MPMLKALLSLAALAMLIKLAMAANKTVGAPGGSWDQFTDLQTWASSRTFSVGDNLIFRYGFTHDVREVSQPDFDSCRVNSPMSTSSGGSTVINLSSPGKRYFVCGRHCNQGMKVEIDTVATSAPPPANPPTSPSDPPTVS